MDEEVVMLLRKIGFALLVAIIFAIPTAIFVYNKFDNNTSDLLDKMNEKTLLFISSHKCSNCEKIEKELKGYNVEYYKINKDIDYQNYTIILNKIDLTEEFAPAPSLVLIENGKLSVNINEFEEFDLEGFLIDYNLL